MSDAALRDAFGRGLLGSIRRLGRLLLWILYDMDRLGGYTQGIFSHDTLPEGPYLRFFWV